MTEPRQAPRLVPVVERQLTLMAIRLVLGAAAIAGAFLAGAERAPGWTGFAFGTGATALTLLTDRRSVLLGEPALEPVPNGAVPKLRPRYVIAGLFPSTVGVSVFAAVSLAFEPILSAVLAGVLAGMGAAGLVGSVRMIAAERRTGMRLFAESGRSPTRRLYGGPR